MTQGDGRSRHQLMYSTGTTPLETMMVIIPSFCYTIITTIIVYLLPDLAHNVLLQFCVEFVTLVIPLILNITILADYALETLAASFMVCVSFMFLLNKSVKPSSSTEKTDKDYITNTRSTINIISVIAILAVDFLIFPRRFAKTATFGYSLMDVGVGLFIFSNAIVDGGQTTIIRSVKGTIPLIFLGLGRLVATKQLDYFVPVSEYGVHWNFFITLAVTKIFVSLLFNVIHVKFIWINALLLLISHEIMLEMGLKNYVMDTKERVGLIEANKEGIVSIVGYVYLYLFSAYFSFIVKLKQGCENCFTTITKLVLLSLSTLILSLLFQNYFGVSRRLANAAYCTWILFIGIFMTSLYYICAKMSEYLALQRLQPPLIFRATNSNGLIFFLISNLLTGAINICLDTLALDSSIGLAVILTYMVVNCSIVCILYMKKIKLKL